jgi:hypothetical protein
MQKGVCKHFTGLGLGGDYGKRCNAGVCYRTHVGGSDLGWAIRVPCILGHKMSSFDSSQVVPCEKYEEPTAEEIAQFERETEAMIARQVKAFPLIEAMKREFEGQDATKSVECPVCKGKLTMTHAAYNGHVWGNCETADCLSWME